jgi:peroxiredoxin
LEALWQKYQSQNVQVLIIDVKESEEITKKWAEARKMTFPVLLDTDGKVAASYAPSGVLPDLPREDVSVASNLVIDPEGEIRFFSLLDTRTFDAKLIALTERLEELLASYESK